MPDLVSVRRFEDHLPGRPRPVFGKRLWSTRSGHPDLVQAQLARVVRQAPEVIVKVSRGLFTGVKLKAHLDYISRHGELALEGADGDLVRAAGRADLVERWVFEAQVANPRASIALPMILSMPAGTPRDGLVEATRSFAQVAFAGGAYVHVLHQDRAHPHVHLTVHSVGPQGRRVIPYKQTVEQWRETFAEQLRRHGVDAEASPRWARGVVRRQDRQAMHHMRERLVSGAGDTPLVLKAALDEAIEVVLGTRQLSPDHQAALSFHDEVHQRFVVEANRLRRSRNADERALGAAAIEFLEALPPPLTRHQTYVARLRLETQSRHLTLEHSKASDLSQSATVRRHTERERSR